MNIVDRFLKYVSFETTSDENTGTTPSTPGQMTLAKYLAEELKTIGMQDVTLDQNGYIMATLPANTEGKPTIGFIAHMDTAPDASGKDVKTSIVKAEERDFIDARYAGQEVIVTDNTTLLGADDKAGIAEIVSAMEYLIEHPEIKHGAVRVGFTPDEEIGQGADHFDVQAFGAEWAYTMDGGTIGELEYENFNAASCKVDIKGVSIHPGSAKDRMKNAARIATEFDSRLPKDEIPERTEGYEGFHHLLGVSGATEEARLVYIIRDHDREKFEARKEFIKNTIAYLNSIYGENTFELEIKDSYYNMKEKIEPYMYLIDNAKAAMEKVGVVPNVVPIRGGTDGARLSYEGLPCPNLSTGDMNAHSIHEFVSVEAMEKMVEVIIELSK